MASLVVGTRLCQLSFVKDTDLMGMTHRRQAMCDHLNHGAKGVLIVQESKSRHDVKVIWYGQLYHIATATPFWLSYFLGSSSYKYVSGFDA